MSFNDNYDENTRTIKERDIQWVVATTQHQSTMVSNSKLQYHSSQSLASLSLDNRVATTTTIITHQGSTSKEALVTPTITKKHIIIVASLGESSKAVAMATHVINKRTMTRSRRARSSSLEGSSNNFVSKGFQMDQVVAIISPTKERKIIIKTSSKVIIMIFVTMVSFNGMHIHLGFQKLGSLKECQALIL